MKYYNSNTIIYLDGRFEKAVDSSTDLYGQSLHYGYAAFEGIRAYKTHNGNRIFKAAAHFDRLERSCQLANIPFPWDKQELIKETYKLLTLNKLKDAYIRPLVFCHPNMKLNGPSGVSILICAWDWDAYSGNKLLKLTISDYERPNPKSTPMEAKLSGNYINSILATTAANIKGYDEALLLDMHGFVAEASGANIFIEKDGKIYTPSLGNILPGITRATVKELCTILDIECMEKKITVEDLKNADSAFLCGTATEIAGIASIDDIVFRNLWRESIGYTIQRAYKNLVLEKVNYEVII
ncbi:MULTISPECIES: branched-chain-amino-acid transaminase [unclassified Pedobacter]|jgi:branched-chain amino acid aminotransferase|uniref:branched-chain-amino-acid transaminase n=1 Tax=Pedobacter TaxID=84567 RepID=UPI000B4BA5C4|nr:MULTISPECIES: branched-chain-amino-acid transaminase [unclassified Pedobacter]MCX2584942.1 branched-chain-amino-acid transaminase [Pedobacter sp. MR22-3]OWK71857.1 branched-chain-amino-acid transaminase [Pedobacter sp. AJM]